MKRNFDSNRSKRWFLRNDLNNDSCSGYVDKLCKCQFQFDNYNFCIFDSDKKSLYLTYGLYSYVIFADPELVGLKVMEKNFNSLEKDKYHKANEFFGDSCWFNCLSWIKKRI